MENTYEYVIGIIYYIKRAYLGPSNDLKWDFKGVKEVLSVSYGKKYLEGYKNLSKKGRWMVVVVFKR